MTTRRAPTVPSLLLAIFMFLGRLLYGERRWMPR